MRLLLSTVLLFIFQILVAQEICDNGIDDDGDGLVDIQDDDCFCVGNFVGVTADWEEQTCCPQTSTPGAQSFDCISDGWSQLAGIISTSDYYNTCGYLGSGSVTIPLPMPSGEGAIGFYTISSADPVFEGASKCLECGFIAGEKYNVSLFIGFPSSAWSFNSSNPEFAIYGKESCTDFENTFVCQPGDDGWTELVTFEVDENLSSWVPVNITFTSPGNYSAIAFGGSCAFGNSNDNLLNYFYLDALQINGYFSGADCGPPPASALLSGNCDAGYSLSASAAGATHFQWYLDGVAIPGATTNPWQVDPVETGDYQVRAIRSDGNCTISQPINFNPFVNGLIVNAD